MFEKSVYFTKIIFVDKVMAWKLSDEYLPIYKLFIINVIWILIIKKNM